MPKEHTVVSYQFDELSLKAKDVARDWFRESALEYDWWESTYEDAANVGLKITAFDLNDHSINAELTTNAVDSAEAVVADHGKECATYRIAASFLKERTKDPGKDEQEDEEYIKDLTNAYFKILSDEADYLTSDEAIDESIQANEYEFHKNGKRFVV